MSLTLKIKKLHPEAKLPVRSTNHAAAYDLYALEDGIVKAGTKSIIKTGVAIRMPQLEPPFRVYGSIRSRSGLSAKHNMEVGAGVIDEDYEHDVGVILYNHHDTNDFSYKKHERIAQLILEVHITPEVVQVDEFEPLEDSNRTGGFGSTGR